ncbi:MAG: autotransporter-associated beta strand repeat-containing protein, partial [Thermoguttaceae bacterium]|nr:autotransporter-associated beta strand repeat-containing protein [Thermoguttaceae bacterium]
MAKYQSRSFIPASILKCASFLLLAVLFALLVTAPALADVFEVTTSQTGTQNWSTSSTLTLMRSCDKGIRFVHNDFYIRSPSTSNNETFAGDIYLGYDYDHYDAENDKDVFTISETSGTLALKNTADSKTITVGNLYMAKGTVIAWGKEKPTLAGNIIVESSEATINSQDAAFFYIASSIVKNTPDAVLNLTPKNDAKGEIWLRNSSNANCPLNLTRGTIVIDGTNTFGNDFGLTLQNGTSIILGGNYVGVAETSIVVNGSVQYGHWQNTSANKVNYSDLIVPAGSTLTAYNKYNEGAKGSMVFVGDLQGAGALVVDTVGSTNTNSLTLGHSQNSFTGTVNVKTGKLQFTVNGHDGVTYTGTNALINAASVAVASGATIDVGATTQTFNNLSGAGSVTVSDGGSLTLNYTAEETTFSGNITSTEEVIKTGNGTLKLNQGASINCPLNFNQGQFYVNATDVSGSNFALTLQDGTSVLLSGNNIGTADSTITVNGTVGYSHLAGTSANKVNYSNILITAGSTLNAENTNGVGAKGSMVFAGDLQGAGTLNVDTVGTSNTNSLTLGHPENSFTGNVNVTRGKLQFTVVGYDNVTYTGTNALINAASVAVASDATIDVGTTEQTFNNLSGAGNITLGDGGSATLNNTTPTEFSGVISGSGSVTKTGAETLTLSGDNTFTGGTTVSEGTLTLTYINGTKGTLATGSSVTVDGETSVLAGHGDVLGYSSGSVGTVNLQNGGTLYNDSTGNHITVGAAINMNNGVITAVEDANGNGTFGNFVFDNAINVTGGEDNEISAKKITLRQYAGTSDEEVGGKITVASGAKLTISSQIAAHTSPTVVPLVKLGDGELVLSGDNTYTTGTYVYGGTLTLEKVGEKGTLATGSTVTVDGSTSVLAGHGDILGYGSKTVG